MADFTIERLRDSFGDCLGECGNLWRSFEPKMTRIGEKMDQIWPILPLKGCVIPLETVWDNVVTFGVHLNPK